MSERLRAMALLIPSFPEQTHVAMWRLGRAIGALGVDIMPVSTRRPTDVSNIHPFLVKAADRTFYAWPPQPDWVLRGMPALFRNGLSALGYLMGCRESPWGTRLKRLPMIVLAAALAARLRASAVDFMLVHSCADAAHLAALCRLLGGPTYGLRLGGDLDVYGTDHGSKMKHAALIVPAAANNAAEVMQRVGVEPGRIVTTWLGVDTARFGAIDRAPLAPGRPVRLLTVARLNLTKGHMFTLHAVGMLVGRGLDIRYDIVGSGDYRTTLEAAVAELGLTERVIFHGARDEAGVMHALGEAHVFVLPSIVRGEASPVALIEAMASGLPPVATRIGGTPQMIDDGIDGRLVPQEDAAAIADAVEDLTKTPERWAKVGAAARGRAEREFDTALVAKRLVAAIERRLAGMDAEV